MLQSQPVLATRFFKVLHPTNRAQSALNLAVTQLIALQSFSGSDEDLAVLHRCVVPAHASLTASVDMSALLMDLLGFVRC